MFGLIINDLENKIKALDDGYKQHCSQSLKLNNLKEKALKLMFDDFFSPEFDVVKKQIEDLTERLDGAKINFDNVEFEKSNYLENIGEYKDYIKVSQLKQAGVDFSSLPEKEIYNYLVVCRRLLDYPLLVADTEEEKQLIQTYLNEFYCLIKEPIDYKNIRFSSSVVPKVKILKNTSLDN